jgi:hypothetical protein
MVRIPYSNRADRVRLDLPTALLPRLCYAQLLHHATRPNHCGYIPAIEAGEVLPGFNDGHQGKAPDLGANELGDPLPHYGPRSR